MVVISILFNDTLKRNVSIIIIMIMIISKTSKCNSEESQCSGKKLNDSCYYSL